MTCPGGPPRVSGANAPSSTASSSIGSRPTGRASCPCSAPSTRRWDGRAAISAPCWSAGWTSSSGSPRLLVVAAEILRRSPERIILDAIEMQRRWQCLRWAIKDVASQSFLRSTLVERSLKIGIPVPAVGVMPTAGKDLRIQVPAALHSLWAHPDPSFAAGAHRAVGAVPRCRPRRAGRPAHAVAAGDELRLAAVVRVLGRLAARRRRRRPGPMGVLMPMPKPRLRVASDSTDLWIWSLAAHLPN